MFNSKKINKLLSLIGIILLIFIIKKVGLKDLISVLSNINPKFFLLSIIPFCLYELSHVLKWALLLKVQKIKIRFIDTLKLTLIGTFWGVITPGNVGNLLRAKYLKELTNKPLSICSVSVFIDKLLEFMSLAFFANIGIFTLFTLINKRLMILTLPFYIFTFFLFFLLVNKKHGYPILKKIFVYLVPNKLKNKTKGFMKDFYRNIPHPKKMALPFIANLSSYLLSYAFMLILAKGLLISISYLQLLGSAPIASLVGLIPITISGLGTNQASLIVLLNNFGVPEEKTLVLSLLSFVAIKLVPAIIGGVLSLKFRFSKN